MTWYRAGTVALTNGSVTVTGTGTAFVSNVVKSEGFVAPDGKIYEIANVPDDTHLTLTNAYLGSTASGQAYSIMPTQSFAAALAAQISGLVNDYAIVRDTVGQGKFSDGTVTAPGFSFSADQDTGFWRIGTNSVGVAVGGTEAARWASTGYYRQGGVASGANPAHSVKAPAGHTDWTGNYEAGTTSGQSYGLRILAGTTSADFAMLIRDAANATNLVSIKGNGYVGIGTTAPVMPLHVSGGGITVSETASSISLRANYAGLGPAINVTSTDPLLFLTANTEYARLTAAGRFGIGTPAPTVKLQVQGSGDLVRYTNGEQSLIYAFDSAGCSLFTGTGQSGVGYYFSTVDNTLTYYTNSQPRSRLLATGHTIIGALTNSGYGNCHRIAGLTSTEGDLILSVDGNNGSYTSTFYAVTGAGFSTTAAAMKIGKDSTTNRSINAGGTINASGADYAEYMRKALGCGTILKGQVCGVNSDGELVTKWDEAKSFVVKSTDPSLVGGDNYAQDVGPKPEAPQEPLEPAAFDEDEPETFNEDEPAPFEDAEPDEDDEDAHAAWQMDKADSERAHAEWQQHKDRAEQSHIEWEQRRDAAVERQEQYDADKADYDEAKVQYDADLAAWETELENARKTVDRIAFSGQVPCIVTGDFEVGDYIVAEPNTGTGIRAVAVKEADMTLQMYFKRIGKVWKKMDDGKAWIDVQHG